MDEFILCFELSCLFCFIKLFYLFFLDTLKILAPFNFEQLLKKIRVDMFRDKDIAQQLVYFIEENLANRISLENKCS